MSINRDDLARIQARTVPLGAKSAEPPRAIHLAPEVREWVTLETVALAPIPVRHDAGWRLISLLATPYQRDEKGRILAYNAPWGFIEWSWPDLAVTRKVAFEATPDATLADALRWRASDPVVAATPPGEVTPLTAEHLVTQERTLYLALDKLLEGTITTPRELSQLALLYAHALPEGAYRYYWLVAPESRQWLRTLTDATEQQPTVVIDDWMIAPPPGARQLVEQLDGWIAQTRQLAESVRAADIVAALRSLEARAHAPGFRLAFIGEFNRGKSTLLNRLFGRDLLPVGDVPVTGVITSIVAGTPERLQIRYPDGRAEERPLTPNAWNDLVANAQPDDIARFPLVHMTVDDPWLAALDAELVDTPGAGDLVEQRVALIYEALGQSDAAVLLVSAHIPFSMTERTFLEEQVFGRHISRVVVVVSQLDEVPIEERESVLQSVRSRVGRVSPNIPVIASHPASAQGSSDTALQEARDAITQLASHADRRQWRGRQLAEQLTDHLAGLIELGNIALAAISANEAERAALRSKQQTAEREASLAWQKIATEIDQRAYALEQTLRQRVGETREDLSEQLLYDLQRSPNPKVWWEQDLPYLLHRQLVSIGRNCESLVLARVNQDTEWLRAAANRQLGASILAAPLDTGDLRAGQPNLRQLPLRDLQRVRLYTRIGCGAATVATYLFLAPLGIAAGIGSTIATEQFVNKQVDQQRQLVRRHVETALASVIEDYLQQITSRVRYLYRDIATELQRAEESRDRSKDAVLARVDTGADASRAAWEQLINAATQLRGTIVMALG